MESDDDKTQTHHVLSNGTEVGHYRIIEKIGAGGMGEVYLAEDTRLNRKVALKFLPQHMCLDKDCRTRFKREAQAAAKLNHPNIVTIYEVGDFHDRPFFAMEHVEGQPLKSLIEQGSISIEFALDIASQLCEGLGKAHSEGIIHRDIKPSNILVDSDGRARLVDFGLATLKQDEKITKTGSTLGTIGYMSPEQVKCKDLDNRSDLFSLGVVFYEMISGRQPFRGDFEAATLNAIINDEPKPLTHYDSSTPVDLQRIISKLLEKDPALRYQTAEGVCPDLKKLTGDYSSTDMAAKPVDWWNRYVVVGAVIILCIVLGYWFFAEYLAGPSGPAEPEKLMLAVLPFDNLGSAEDEYFADGITDEITSRLAMVHGMGVISRTSAYAYKNSDKTLPQIAKELGVDYILEGTIRWDKTGETEKVRVTPQLIRVKDDLHMWAENYEEAITGIFEVQVAIATHIIDALDLTLATSERSLIEDQPTDNIEAYNLYLQGKEYWDLSKIDLALPLLERSVEVDSTFARAYSLLARLHGFSYYNMLDRSEERLEKCEKAANNAVRFSEGGIDGNIAMGYYFYYGLSDYDRALDEFEKVARLQPSNSDVRTAMAYVQRRQGKWQEAVNNLSIAYDINPHSRNLITNYAITLQCTRQYDEMIRILDKSLLLSPGATELLFLKAGAVLESSRDTSKVREILDQAAQYGEKEVIAFYMEGFDMILGDYESAANRRKVPGDFLLADSGTFYLNKGDAYRYLGRDSLSRVYYDSARMVVENEIEAMPGMAFIHTSLGCAYAGLGRFQDAIREGEKAVEICPITRDAFYGPAMMGELAYMYTAAGKYDRAMDLLDSLMNFPSGFGIYNMQLHPRWDPLRDHPRFKALLEKHSPRE